MSDPAPVSVALVGCGWISGAHVDGYKALWQAGYRGMTITACCDLNRATAEDRARQIAAFQGTMPQVFTTTQALIAAQVAQAADICLPHCFHHATAIQLLEAGLHVQLEKPLGITVRASKAIIRAAEAAGRVLATAENTRRHLGARAAVWAVRSAKLIGEPLHGIVSIARDSRPDLSDPKWAWRNVTLINGGGPLIDGGAHFADMMIQLFGEVQDVACETRILAPRVEVTVPIIGKTMSDAEDWWHAVIRFTSGMRVTWSYSHQLPGKELSTGVYYGRSGALTDESGWLFHAFEGGGSLQTPGAAALGTRALEERYLASLSGAERERLFPLGVRDSFAIEIWDFVEAVRTGRRPEMDGQAGLASKALCLACYESAALGGTRVRYADVLSGAVDAYQRPIDERWGLLSRTAVPATAQAAR